MLKRLGLYSCVGLLVLTYSHHANAQAAAAVDDIVTAYRDEALGWTNALGGEARVVFGCLSLIEFAWSMCKVLLRKGDLFDVGAELINQVIFIGFFFWLMTTTDYWGPAIIDSWRRAGNAAANQHTMHPGDVLAIGINLGSLVLSQISLWTPKSSFVLVLAGILLLISFVYICAAMVIALVESYWAIGIAILVMAFGGSRWTNGKAVGVLHHMFGLGVRLFTLQACAGEAGNMGVQWVGQIGAMDTKTIMTILGGSLTMMALAWELPKSLERMVNGTSTTSGGNMIGAMATGAGAIGAAGAGAVGVASGTAGVASTMAQSARLASEQLAASESPPTGMAHAAAMVGRTMGNMASAVATDLGRSLSGQQSGAGSAPWRASADLANRRRLLGEDQNRPSPPSPPGNGIGSANSNAPPPPPAGTP